MSSKPFTPEQVRELQPLREVIARQFGQPVMPTAEGFSDLVDRVTVAVAAYMGRVVPTTPPEARRLADVMERATPSGVITGPPELLDKITNCPECGELYRLVLVGTPDEGLSCTHKSGCTWVWTRPPDRWFQDTGSPEGPYGPTVDGIRPHRPVTPEQDARMREAAEQWETDNPMTPERAVAALAGRRNPTSCLGCGQPWIDAAVRHLPDCPVPDRGAHWSAAPEMEAAAREGWKTHGPQGAAVAAGCPGCGAVPVKTGVGRHTRHLASCTVTAKRYGECPQTERHAAHQWTGGLADEVRYWCDGEPSTATAGD